MSKRPKTRKEPKTCDNCSNCIYIGEGDHACMASAEPVIVKEEHMPNDNYCRCGGELWEEEI